jgi:hypothetical protein
MDDSLVAECGHKIDRALADPYAAEYLKAFYDASTRYVGRSFALIGNNPPGDIVPDDLLAVTMMGGSFNARNIRRLLDPDSPARAAILTKLRAVRQGNVLGRSSGAQIVAGKQLGAEIALKLNVVPGSASVTKLCARKRPSFLPICDSVVGQYFWLGADELLSTLNEAFTRERRQAVRTLAQHATALGGTNLNDVPTLRLLDSVIWMTCSNAAERTRDALKGH